MIDSLLVLMIIVFLIFVVSILPLYFAVKILEGETTLLKTILVMIIAGLVTSLITAFVPFGGILAFLALIFIYHWMFEIGIIRAFFVWVLQVVFIALLFYLLVNAGYITLPAKYLFFI